MKVKISRNKIIDVLQHITDLLNNDHPQKLNYALIKIKRSLESEVQLISKQLKKLENERVSLCLQYCDKDEEGKPITVNNSYQGLEMGVNEDFDKQLLELNERKEEYLNANLNMNSVHGVSEGMIPERMNGLQQEALSYFIIPEDIIN